MIKALATFLATFSASIFFNNYLKCMLHNSSLLAGFWGVLAYLIASVAVLSYTSDPSMLLYASVGCFAGTLLAASVK